VDLQNAVVWISDSKTPNGISEVPLTSLAIEAFKSQMAISGEGARYCFQAIGFRTGTRRRSNCLAENSSTGKDSLL